MENYILIAGPKSRVHFILQFNGREVLQNAGKVSAEIAKKFAENEFQQYRITQDRLFESDFDKELQKYLDETDADSKKEK